MRMCLLPLFMLACVGDDGPDKDGGRDTAAQGCADGEEPGTWYVDDDGDGHGARESATTSCDAPAGTVAAGDDCDDEDVTVTPDADEVCADGIDQNCDGTADNGCALLGDLTDGSARTSIVNAGGNALAAADVDGDGSADLLLGNEEGERVDVLWGPLAAGELSGLYDGNDLAGGDLGRAVATGDLDGDGAADVIAGFSGDAVLVSGTWTRADRDVAEATASFDGANEALEVGDLNGDGRADVVLGHGSNTANGEFAVQFGPLQPGYTEFDALNAHFTSDQDDDAGWHPVVAGDTNGDGIADLLAGGPEHSEGGASGQAWLVLGPLSAGERALADSDTVLRGEERGYAGHDVGPAGDLDGDGYADIVVGAYDAGSNHNGRAYVLLGPVDGGVVELAAADSIVEGGSDERCGLGISPSSGDLDGDGNDDLVIGCPYNLSNVNVYYGPLAAGYLTPEAVITAEEEGDAFGEDLRLVPDLTGDGLDDLVVAAPDAGGGLGRVFLFAGGPR